MAHMALPLNPQTFLRSLQNPNKITPSYSLRSSTPPLLFSPLSSSRRNPTLSSSRLYSNFADGTNPPSGHLPSPRAASESPKKFAADAAGPGGVADEWGEESAPETSYTRLSETDPVEDDDEWGRWEVNNAAARGNGSAAAAAAAAAAAEEERNERLLALKRCLVDSVYGTNFGFQGSAELRAEVSELINQLEAANPTPAPMEAPELLDGKWVLVYTAFSELLPLLASGTTPLLKVEKICQVVDSSSLTIENFTMLSTPLATFSFGASAVFEVRSPSRIQVQFKEGTLQPPEILSSVNLPDNVDVLGQKLNLSPVQQFLNPLVESLAGFSRLISGQPPLKIPIRQDRPKSWLLTTYLDKDLRISRGDGGLFVLFKEGSPLLLQQR